MAEQLLITGPIGSALYTATCTDTGGTGSMALLGWIIAEFGPYTYTTVTNNLAQFRRLFGPVPYATFYTDATTPCPRPVIDRVAPRSMPAGGADVTLHVYGRDFTPRSQIVFNGGLETTVFVSQLELTTIIVGATATTPGDYPVAVHTAAPGGGTSGTRLFALLAP